MPERLDQHAGAHNDQPRDHQLAERIDRRGPSRIDRGRDRVAAPTTEACSRSERPEALFTKASHGHFPFGRTSLSGDPERILDRIRAWIGSGPGFHHCASIETGLGESNPVNSDVFGDIIIETTLRDRPGQAAGR